MSQSPPTVAPALIRKLDEKLARFTSLREQMNDPAVLSNPQQLIAISKESGQLEPVTVRYQEYLRALRVTEELRAMIANRADAEMADLAAAELPDAIAK